MAEANDEGLSHNSVNIRTAILPGANATTTTVTGIKTTDKILSATYAVFTHSDTKGVVVSDYADKTSLFSISAADTITNSTDLSAGIIILVWEVAHPGT